jgi:hypothetical protein
MTTTQQHGNHGCNHGDGCFCDQTTNSRQYYHINKTMVLTIVDDSALLSMIVVSLLKGMIRLDMVSP